eukprot:6410556-Amphidinium_carterae.1
MFELGSCDDLKVMSPNNAQKRDIQDGVGSERESLTPHVSSLDLPTIPSGHGGVERTTESQRVQER